MKKFKYIIVSALFIFVASTTLQAQSVGDAKVNAEKKAEQIKKDAEDRAEKEKKHAQDKMKDAKKGANETEEKYNAVKSDYKEKIKAAASDEEKKKLEAEMMDNLREIREAGDEAGDVVKKGEPIKDDVKKIKEDAAKAKEEAEKKASDAADTASEDVKINKEYGMNRANQAKKKMAQREEALKSKMSMVDKGKSRIRAATDRVDAALANGDITEEEAVAKRIKIAAAQERLDRLENSIKDGQASYERQKATLGEMYKEEKEN